MKTKIFALLAAMMLLVGTTAMAQSGDTKTSKTTETELKGDVNSDGIVDVADIAAVIAVMNEQGTVETQYYWYAGQTQPTSMSTDPTVDDVNFTNNKWHTLANGTTQIKQGVQGGTSGNNWYVAFPESFGFEIKASDLITTDTTATKLSNITINGKTYNLYKLNSTAARTTIYAAKKIIIK